MSEMSDLNPADPLDKMVAQAAEMAADVFARDGQLMPVWIVETLDSGFILPTPWCSPREKYAMIDVLRAMFADVGAVRYVVIVEAWMAKVDGKKGEAPPRIEPSKHPNRVEAAVIMGSDKAGRSRMITRKIIRPKKAPAYLGEIRLIGARPSEMLGGDMVDLLVDKKQH